LSIGEYLVDQKLVSRRKFLKIAGGALGAGVLTCGGGALLGLRTPSSVVFPEQSFCEGQGKKILVAYATKCGATAEISQVITESLCASGLSAELKRANSVKSIIGYQGVVLGTAIYMSSPLKEATSFIEKFSSQMTHTPLAIFDVSLTMKEATSENQKVALGYLESISNTIPPIKTGAFSGRIDLSTLPPLYRMFAQADSEGVLAAGDFRDWKAISTWAKELGVVLANYS
jgi:menaquinone-dependent protoporphyrinogen oxidase